MSGVVGRGAEKDIDNKNKEEHAAAVSCDQFSGSTCSTIFSSVVNENGTKWKRMLYSIYMLLRVWAGDNFFGLN